MLDIEIRSEKIGVFGKLYNEDCLDILKQLPDNSITTIITDPPAGIAFMNKNWDKNKGGRSEWTSWLSEIMKECLRVTKPGGMIAVWALPRTAHWTATAIEDAGFTVRDKIYHIFGSGFPKSSNISKQLQKKNKIKEVKLFDGYGTATKPAVEEWIMAMAPLDGTFAENALKHGLAGINIDNSRIAGIPWKAHNATGLARNKFFSEGPTKIIHKEPHTKGRWPSNLILQHHPECVKVGVKKVKSVKRIKSNVNPYESNRTWSTSKTKDNNKNRWFGDKDGNEIVEEWDCHESCPIKIMNEQVGIKKSGAMKHTVNSYDGESNTHFLRGKSGPDNQYRDKGYVSRYFLNLLSDPGFFYCAKASTKERNHGCENLPSKDNKTYNDFKGTAKHSPKKNCLKNNFHPTCKPVNLMKYLIKLLAPPQNPIILDMFAGSGTTGVACEQLNIPYILIEKESEYCAIIRARVNAANKPIRKVKQVKDKEQKSGLFNLEEINTMLEED